MIHKTTMIYRLLVCILLLALLLPVCSCVSSTKEPEATQNILDDISDTDPAPSTDTTKPAEDPPPSTPSTTPPTTLPTETPPAEDIPPETYTVTLNGAPLSEWAIGYNPRATGARAIANDLATFFAAGTDEVVEVVNRSNATGLTKNMIIVGAIGRSVKAPDYFQGEYYVSETDQMGSMVTMLSSKTNGLAVLAAKLKAETTTQINGGTIALTIAEGESVHFDAEDYSTVPQWNLKRTSTQEYYPGVTYTESVYYDEYGLPYRTYALILDMTKVNLYVGTSNDGYDRALSSGKRQTTMQHMHAAVANGKNIIAGVNANFFNINGDYSPLGVVVKDGTVIQGNVRPRDMGSFFAVTESGEIIMDDGDNFATATKGKNVTQAVAGNKFILKNGLLTEDACEPEQGPHPRTVVGRTSDGKVIIGVLDGRQESHSNGGGYVRTALWMRSLGAVDVINLDGGGSSNLVLRDISTNTYTTENRPSDGSLRKVHTSLLVGLK